MPVPLLIHLRELADSLPVFLRNGSFHKTFRDIPARSRPDCCRVDEGLRKIQNDGVGTVIGMRASQLVVQWVAQQAILSESKTILVESDLIL